MISSLHDKDTSLNREKAEQTQGWLFKRGHFRTNWTNRYFMIDKSNFSANGYSLVYFKKSVSLINQVGFNKPKGSIPLRDATIFPRARDGHPFGFQINCATGRNSSKPYPMRAASFEERRVWIETLELLIDLSSPEEVINSIKNSSSTPESNTSSPHTSAAAAADDDDIAEISLNNSENGTSIQSSQQGGKREIPDVNNTTSGDTEQEMEEEEEKREIRIKMQAEDIFRQAKKDEIELLFKMASSQNMNHQSSNMLVVATNDDELKQLVSKAHKIVELYRKASELFEESDDFTLRKSRGEEISVDEVPTYEAAMFAMRSFISKPKISALFAYAPELFPSLSDKDEGMQSSTTTTSSLSTTTTSASATVHNFPIELPDVVIEEEEFEHFHQDEDPNFFLPPPPRLSLSFSSSHPSSHAYGGHRNSRSSAYRYSSTGGGGGVYHPSQRSVSRGSDSIRTISASERANSMSAWYRTQRDDQQHHLLLPDNPVSRISANVRLTMSQQDGNADIYPMEEEEDDDDEEDAHKMNTETKEEMIPSTAATEDLHYWGELDKEAALISECTNDEATGWLIDNGFDVDDLSKPAKSPRFPVYKTTPMFEACAGGDLALVKWLWNRGAHPDAKLKDKYGNTPFLMAVCETGSIIVASWLLKQFAIHDDDDDEDHDDKDGIDYSREGNNFGSTPLIIACQRGHFDAVKWLLHCTNAVADFQVPNNSGWTPMLIACLKGHLEIVTWFVNENMPTRVLFARNHAGSGPILVAASQGFVELVLYLCHIALLRFTPSPPPPPPPLPQQQLVTTATSMVQNSLSITKLISLLRVTNKFGENALKAACKNGHIETAVILLMFGGLSLERMNNEYFPIQNTKTLLSNSVYFRIMISKFLFLLTKKFRLKKELEHKIETVVEEKDEEEDEDVNDDKYDDLPNIDISKQTSKLIDWLLDEDNCEMYGIVREFIGLPSSSQQLHHLIDARKALHA